MKLIISDEELSKSIKPIIEPKTDNVETVVIPKRGHDGKKISEETKVLVALEGSLGANQEELSKIHGVSQAAVSYLSRGKDRTNLEGQKDAEGISELIRERKLEMSEKLSNKLLTTLDIFDPRKLDQEYMPKSIAVMVSALNNLIPGDSVGAGVNFQIFAPQMKTENNYKVVVVKE
jgi:predicted transcriptional regulator